MTSVLSSAALSFSASSSSMLSLLLTPPLGVASTVHINSLHDNNNENANNNANANKVPPTGPTNSKELCRLSCRLLNARSLCNKLIDYQDLSSTEHLDIVTVNETWLNDSIPDELIIDSHSSDSIYRKDLLTHGGGGVCLAINNKTVSALLIAVPDTLSDHEVLALDILNSSPLTRVVTCYSPQLSDTSQNNLTYMT